MPPSNSLAPIATTALAQRLPTQVCVRGSVQSIFRPTVGASSRSLVSCIVRRAAGLKMLRSALHYSELRITGSSPSRSPSGADREGNGARRPQVVVEVGGDAGAADPDADHVVG